MEGEGAKIAGLFGI